MSAIPGSVLRAAWLAIIVSDFTASASLSPPSRLGLDTLARLSAQAACANPGRLLEREAVPEVEVPYWADPRIHNFGNTGFMGAIHAAVAPFFTHLIDRFAYEGVDARKLVHSLIDPSLSVVDMGCGTGFSTFPGATAIDTSAQMVNFARLLRRDATFVQGNAETWGRDASYDVATVMFCMHEMPRWARQKVLNNAARVARKMLLVVDIDPSFAPTEMMLSGEPYVLDYLEHMDDDVAAAARARAWRRMRVNVVPEHVVMWRLDL